MLNLINGDWRRGQSERPNVNPHTGEEIDQSAIASAQDLEDASAAAMSAFSQTRQRPIHARATILHRVAELLKAQHQRFTDCMTEELGRPIDFNRNEVDRAIFTFTNAAEEAKRLNGEYLPLDLTPACEGRYAYWRREAIGPVLAITPFNFPLNLLAHKVAPAIAAGCPFTVKVPPQTPNTARLLGEVLMEAGCIAGECNILDMSPEVAEAAVRDERYKLLTFTGSPKVGWYLKSVAGKKRVLLELGNASAAIVHHDANNLEWIVKRLRIGAFAAAGQVCISVQRIFVHKERAADFVGRFVMACEALKPENPRSEGALIGPMVDESAAERVEAWIKEAVDAGAKVIAGQRRREGRHLWPVVLADVAPEMKVSCEEVFGPVVSIETYTDVDDALARVNDTPFGLQVGVFSDSLEVIERVVDGAEVAGVIVNDFPTFRIDHMPYGGIKDSGLGREGVKYALDEYTEKKLIVFNRKMA
ncbi:MAG: aldehyde dehydrogenase family protein [Planctomycetes bacterium]|nr:aldehyde dehydrogenase family protein [Planctomycetota bacterium]